MAAHANEDLWPLLAWGAAAAFVAVRRFAAEAVDEAAPRSRARLFKQPPKEALR